MAKKLVRRGRVRGYRPTRDQLEEILDLAQRGIEGDSIAHLTYSQGDLEIYPRGDLKKVMPNDLQEIAQEAANPASLNNLAFSINQDSPVRMVNIKVGPGEWTTYQIESDDQTWAYGRYHEQTDNLLGHRALYAKFRASHPQALQEGTGDTWKSRAWDLTRDWRVIFTGILALIPFMLPIALALYIAFMAVLAYGNPATPGETKQQLQTSIHDQKDALVQFHWIAAHAGIIAALALSYIILLYALWRWLRTFLRSKIVLRNVSPLSSFSFRGANTDPVVLGTFYTGFILLIATIVSMIIQYG